MQTHENAKERLANRLARDAVRLSKFAGRVRKHRTIETPLSGLSTALYKTLVAMAQQLPTAPTDESRGG